MSQPSISRPRLCVAMIVRNAAETLEATLHSVASIADEIVLLDTGSTDETLTIAERYKAVVGRRPWDDDFSAARNTCLAAVMADWVLWLDAGETMSADDALALRNFIDQQAETRAAYALLVRVPQQPGSVAGEQIARVRLVPNLPGVRFDGRVRESLVPSLEKLGIALEGLPFRIQRGMREHDLALKVRRARRNLLIADMEMKQCGPQARLLNCIGDALQVLGDYAQAAEFFRQAIAHSPRGSTEMLEAYYGLITTYDGDGGGRQSQLAICLEALDIFSLDPQLMCAMGGYLQAQGRLDLALRSYQTAYQYGQANPEAWHLDEIQEIAAVCYSLALQLQNRDDEARQALEAAVEANPACMRLHRSLIDMHVKAGRRNEAVAQTQRMPPGTPHVESLRIAIRGACLANDKNWIGARAYLETAYKAGCRELLCLRWLAVTLLSLNQTEAARPILAQWLALDPSNAEARSYADAIAPVKPSDTATATHAPPAAKPAVPPAPPAAPAASDRLRRFDRNDANETLPPPNTHAPVSHAQKPPAPRTF